MRTVSLLLALLSLLAVTAGADEPLPKETFQYRWHLGGVSGAVAGLFLPSQGDGVLSFEPKGYGTVKSELYITSKKSDRGEFWRYGSMIDIHRASSTEAWSSYRWKDEEKSKHAEIEQDGVLDIVAGIYSLRRNPPDQPRQMEIWSDGKIYPVVVIPKGLETRKVAGRQVSASHLSVRGRNVQGERRWKGSMELWLTEDGTPVEIRISRKLANLHLELVRLP